MALASRWAAVVLRGSRGRCRRRPPSAKTALCEKRRKPSSQPVGSKPTLPLSLRCRAFKHSLMAFPPLDFDYHLLTLSPGFPSDFSLVFHSLDFPLRSQCSPIFHHRFLLFSRTFPVTSLGCLFSTRLPLHAFQNFLENSAKSSSSQGSLN